MLLPSEGGVYRFPDDVLPGQDKGQSLIALPCCTVTGASARVALPTKIASPLPSAPAETIIPQPMGRVWPFFYSHFPHIILIKCLFGDPQPQIISTSQHCTQCLLKSFRFLTFSWPSFLGSYLVPTSQTEAGGLD
jgi:hypothetical protein